jgi:DNA repair photolyase
MVMLRVRIQTMILSVQYTQRNAEGLHMSWEKRSTLRGRGAASNPPNRYHPHQVEAQDDGWGSLEENPPALKTTLQADTSRSVITRNQSPDIPFDRSINPYRGCEHGCIYCYARPSHAWLDLSPGLDFESRLLHKPDAPELLRRELARAGYRCAPIALGSNTDAYQPVEREQRLTRRILEVLDECAHPVMLITKSALIERDLDILGRMAKRDLVQVAISFSTTDPGLARRLEPRAASPGRRLESLGRLAQAGIPVGVLVAPVIPVLSDGELERILQQARERGASFCRYVLLRLPGEVAPLFQSWLEEHAPGQADRVMNRLRDCRQGEVNSSRFGDRMTGSGDYAGLIAQRFHLTARRLGYSDGPGPALSCEGFRPPSEGRQMALFPS